MSQPRKQLPYATQVKLYREDHWLCYLCKRPVIFAPAIRLLQLEFNSPGLYHLNFSREFSPLLDELAGALDHVDPHARGGAHGIENRRAICNKCNGQKSDIPYLEWVKKMPKKKHRGKDSTIWDGLSGLFVQLAKRNPSILNPAEKKWLAALENEAA